MADTKISDLPADASVAGTEQIPVNDGGTNKRVTVSQIATYTRSLGSFTLVSVQLSAAQILALHTTPITLVPALGGRNYVVPFEVVAHYRAGATPFNNFLQLFFGWGTTVADVRTDSVLAADLLIDGVTTDRYSFAYEEGDYEKDAAVMENVPFAVALSADSGIPTVGDGTITLRFYYDVIDGAP